MRLICATNSDIHQMVADGYFRQDLLYRINTIEIKIPPLRERGEDILLLAENFLQRYIQKYKKNIKGITREGKQKLMKYHWPGNVRELQHAMERAVLLSEEQWLKPACFMLEPQPERKIELNEELNLATVEINTIKKAIKKAQGNMNVAAEYLGITRFALYRKLEKLDI